MRKDRVVALGVIGWGCAMCAWSGWLTGRSYALEANVSRALKECRRGRE